MSNPRSRPSYVATLQQRSAAPLAAGAFLAMAAFAAATLVERQVAAQLDDPESEGEFGAYYSRRTSQPDGWLTLAWSPIVLGLTLSGLQIWKSPASPRRAKALTLWALVQSLNAAWMAIGPRRFGGQLTAVATIGAAALTYLWEARRVQRSADAALPTPPEGARDIVIDHIS